MNEKEFNGKKETSKISLQPFFHFLLIFPFFIFQFSQIFKTSPSIPFPFVSVFFLSFSFVRTLGEAELSISFFFLLSSGKISLSFFSIDKIESP